MRRHASLSILAVVSLGAVACAGSADLADQSALTTLAPDPARGSEPSADEPAVTTGEPADGTITAVVPPGARSVVSERSFEDTVAAVVAEIEANAALTLVAQIDHGANAETVGLDLGPTVELIFGNPVVGTPLMVASAGVGIDLPQKMLVIESDGGAVQVVWNGASHLATRHGLVGVDEPLSAVDGVLASIAFAAAGDGDDLEMSSGPDTELGAGLVTLDASGTARAAADRLLVAIEENPNLELVAEIDHAANAASVDLELSPIIEVIFGNPSLGTPLMQASPTSGLDLPQKMLFVETSDGVTISYNDPLYLAERHTIDPALSELSTIADALGVLSALAAGEG